MIELLRKLDRDLLRDHKNNTYNIHKIGNVVVVFSWTLYMMSIHPDSVEMWSAYSLCLMGFSSLQYGQKRIHDRADAKVMNEPPAT